MAAKFEVIAEPRDAKGKSASRRLRHAGRVPAVIYGAGKDPQMLTLDQNVMMRNLANEKFHAAIIDVKIGGSADQAILRDWQMHPYKPMVVHVDLQRISATEKIHMRIPLHFTGQDVAVGVKQDGGVISHIMSEIDITCLPKDLPEFIEVDMSNVRINQSVHFSDLKLPQGVQITSLAHGGDDLAVAAITHVKVVEEAAPVVAAAPAEGAAAAAPAEGEKKAAEGEKKPAEAEKKPAAKK